MIGKNYRQPVGNQQAGDVLLEFIIEDKSRSIIERVYNRITNLIYAC